MIVGGIVAMLCVTLPVLVIMGGIYLITSVKQESLNMRESMRTERAIAKMNLENSYGNDDDDGGMNIMDGIAAVTQLMGNRNQTTPVAPTTDVIDNAKTQQNQ